MASYRLVIKRSVAKDLRALPSADVAAILKRIQALADDPRPPGCEKLSPQERYRVRQDVYRLLCEIRDQQLVVTAVKVGHRRDAYRIGILPMSNPSTTTIRLFGALDAIRRERGLKPAAEVRIPAEGRTARDIARELDLPFDKIEGVFVNHVVYDLDHLVLPGDRVAFVSTGVPGPHRFMLGIHRAGRKRP